MHQHLHSLPHFRAHDPLHGAATKGAVCKDRYPMCWRHPPTRCPDLDPTKYRPTTVDMAGSRNCFCIIFSYIVSGTVGHAKAIEDWVLQLRTGPHASLYKTFDADPLDSPGDPSVLTRTDIKIIARELGINLYEYFSATSGSPARWETNSGNKKGPFSGVFILLIPG